MNWPEGTTNILNVKASDILDEIYVIIIKCTHDFNQHLECSCGFNYKIIIYVICP